MAAFLIFCVLLSMGNGEKILTRPVQLPTLCLPNCECTPTVADCTLEFCGEDFEITYPKLILRGTICENQWTKLANLQGTVNLELHNARCRELLHCE